MPIGTQPLIRRLPLASTGLGRRNLAIFTECSPQERSKRVSSEWKESLPNITVLAKCTHFCAPCLSVSHSAASNCERIFSCLWWHEEERKVHQRGAERLFHLERQWLRYKVQARADLARLWYVYFCIHPRCGSFTWSVSLKFVFTLTEYFQMVPIV